MDGAVIPSTPEAVRSKRRSVAARLLGPTLRFLSTESGRAGLLIAAAVTALVWANSPWSGAYEALLSSEAGISIADWSLNLSLEHWVNDGLMALFFFVIGLEVRREFSVGELTSHGGRPSPCSLRSAASWSRR